MTEYDQRRKYLLARQKGIEAKLEKLKAGGMDRRSRQWNELEGEYDEIVVELESMEARKWKLRTQ